MKKYFGFEKLFDFSHEHSLYGKCKNLFFVFAFNVLCTAGMSKLLQFAGIMSKNQLATLFNPIGWAYYANILAAIPANMYNGALFFMTCIMAPFWEETVFRIWPIIFVLFLLYLAILLERILNILAHNTEPSSLDSAELRSDLLIATWAFTSIIFGMGHGSPLNILFQGVAGGSFFWLYRKNKSFIWPMMAHSLWNIMVIFGFNTFS